jgi:hypothetical protein
VSDTTIEDFIRASDNANDYADRQVEDLQQQALEDIDRLYNDETARDVELWEAIGADPKITAKEYDSEDRESRDLNWVAGLAALSAAATVQFFLDNRKKTIFGPIAYRQQKMSGFDLGKRKLISAGKRGFEIEGAAEFARLKRISDKRLLRLLELKNAELYNELVSIGAMRPADKIISDSIGYVSRMTDYATGSPQFKQAVADLINKDAKRSILAMNRRAIERMYTASEVDGDMSREMVWIVEGGPNTCQYCLDRAGVVKTYAEWLKQGLPGSDVCRGGDLCRCHLAAS